MGQIAVTDNIDQAYRSLSLGVKVISLSESDQQLITAGALPGVILSPPVDAVMEFVDGNYEMSYRIYDEYIKRPEVESFICAIYTCVRFTNENVLIYIGKDDVELGLINRVLDTLFTFFIIITDQGTKFTNIGLFKSYIYDIIDFSCLVLNIDLSNFYFDPQAGPKIANEIGYFRPQSIVEEFYDYVYACQQNGNLLKRALIIYDTDDSRIQNTRI